MTAERCGALAVRAIQLQAHTAELACRMGELNTHVTTGQAIMSDANARNAASSGPDQSLPAMDDTSATAQYVAQSRLPLMHSSNQMAATLESGAGSPVAGHGRLYTAGSPGLRGTRVDSEQRCTTQRQRHLLRQR